MKHEYEKLYWKYVEEKKYNNVIKARYLMEKIFESQMETGNPYILYKDNINRKSNQSNLGTIKSSNLCAEIVEYSNSEEYAVCNLASIAINSCVKEFKFNKNKEWIIYTKENCNFCKWAKYFLNYHDVSFVENTNISELKEKLKVETITFPQIFYDKTHIGGFNELIKFTKGTFDFKELLNISYNATISLNKVIDINYYPVDEAKRSNLKHRPIGLGIQGLANALALLGINFDSDESVEFNAKMMETIYYGAIKASVDICMDRVTNMIQLKNLLLENNIELTELPEFYDKKLDLLIPKINNLYHLLKVQRYEINRKNDNILGSYASFENSPTSKGILQFDLWNKEPNSELKYNWKDLKENIKMFGLRNSLVTALMPTASTSQIMNNNECFEYFTNNVYTRKTLAGDFPLINKHLVEDLISIGEWNTQVKQIILADNGSIKQLKNVPDIFKKQYKTIWEIGQIWVLKNAVARGPFVDQTQSMNIFMPVPDSKKLNSCLFYGWKNGLKTGIYYLRTKAAKNAIKFTVDPTLIKSLNSNDDNPCESCSA